MQEDFPVYGASISATAINASMAIPDGFLDAALLMTPESLRED